MFLFTIFIFFVTILFNFFVFFCFSSPIVRVASIWQNNLSKQKRKSRVKNKKAKVKKCVWQRLSESRRRVEYQIFFFFLLNNLLIWLGYTGQTFKYSMESKYYSHWSTKILNTSIEEKQTFKLLKNELIGITKVHHLNP